MMRRPTVALDFAGKKGRRDIVVKYFSNQHAMQSLKN
jgi:hypothetical protein